MNQNIVALILAVTAVVLYLLYKISLYSMVALDRIFYMPSLSPLMAWTIVGAIIGLVYGIAFVLLKSNLRIVSVLVVLLLFGCIGAFGKMNWTRKEAFIQKKSKSTKYSSLNLESNGVVTSENADILTSASKNSDIVYRLPKGGNLKIEEEQGSWSKVSYATDGTVITGWISRDLIRRNDRTSTQERSNTNSLNPSNQEEKKENTETVPDLVDTGFIVIGSARLMDNPSEESASRGQIGNNEIIDVIEQSGNWVKVATKSGITGWIRKSQVQLQAK